MIDYKVKTLKNGLKIITAPIKTTDAVTVFILTGVGGRFENKENNGISHLVEHLFFKGSKNYKTANIINKELDSLGANYNAFTGSEYTGFYIQSAADDFSKSFALLSDMFLNPLFPEEEFEKEKTVVLEETKYRHDMPQWLIHVLSQKGMFGSQPIGMDISGEADKIKAFKHSDIVSFYKTYYRPSSSIIVIAGNPKDSDWEKTVEETFQDFAHQEIPIFEPYKPVGTEKLISRIKKVDQTHFSFSALTYPRNDPKNYALSILITILAGGSSSRLFTKIREEKGWAYDVRSDISQYHDTGTISIYGGLMQDKVANAMEIILKEIEDLKKNGPNQDELERAKKNLRGHLALSLEDSMEIAGFLSDEIFYLKTIRSPEEIVAAWEKVTADEVKAVAQEIFQSGKMGLALIGPKDYKKQLENLF